MDWLQHALGVHGGTLLGIVAGAVFLVVVVAMADRHKGAEPETRGKKPGSDED